VIEYVLPHPIPPWPEGHVTRANIVAQAIPDLVIVDRPGPRQKWDAAIFDTYGEAAMWATLEARACVAERTPIVSIERALSERTTRQPMPWDLRVVPGPYEGTSGEVIDPLVRVAPEAPVALDVLVIVSRRPSQDHWWPEVGRQLREAKVDYLILTADRIPGESNVTGVGPDWIAAANVVIGGAGMSMYEALWAGKRLVAKPFSVEQQTRLDGARNAGEAAVEITGSVVDAIAKVRGMEPIGRREPGTARFGAMMAGLRRRETISGG
jgi:hypothetical protein